MWIYLYASLFLIILIQKVHNFYQNCLRTRFAGSHLFSCLTIYVTDILLKYCIFSNQRGFRNMKVLLVTRLILVVAFLEEREGRRSSLTRMTRSDPSGPALEEVEELSIESGKRMGDFGLSERMRPRMGKGMYEIGMDIILLCLFILTV